MKIMSVRWEPVSRILAIIYAVFGLGSFLMFAFSDTQYLTLPVGFVAYMFHLNFNFNLPRPTNIVFTLLYGIAAVLAFALSGWITGAASAWCFNLMATLTDGIDGKYVSTIEESTPIQND